MSDNVQDQPASPENAGGPGNGDDGFNEEATSVVDPSRRKRLLVWLGAIVVGLGILFFIYEEFIAGGSVSTDNAYVQGEPATITPLTSGRVAEVYVTDTQPVRKGQILFRIEDSDQKIALQQAKAGLEYAQRRFGQSIANNTALAAAADASEAEIASARAQVASADAALERARSDFERRQRLSGSGAVSGEELTRAREALTSAEAAARQARAGLEQARSSAVSAKRQEEAARALTDGSDAETAPEVLLAKAQLATAELDMKRTVIRSPIDGVVSQRTIQVGQRIENGSSAMIVVPLNRLYVDANFKEDQLGEVRSGQRATLTSDFYGDDVVYHGKVVGFSGGTGAAFSLIPAQNATGNWIKVVQRLPVRIELDAKELEAHPLRIGLSMEAEIDLSSKD